MRARFIAENVCLSSHKLDMADALHATVKLEELKTKLRVDGHLYKPNHADADSLLRAWNDPTMAELVPECAFVVRFTQIKTTKSHIQGAGRARRDNAKVFYFDNSPEEEQEKAALLDEVARDGTLALSMEERLRRIRVDDRAVPGLYPFGTASGEDPDPSGEVNLYNAENIFTNYCCQVLGQSIDVQESLFKIDSQLVRTCD